MPVLIPSETPDPGDPVVIIPGEGAPSPGDVPPLEPTIPGAAPAGPPDVGPVIPGGSPTPPPSSQIELPSLPPNPENYARRNAENIGDSQAVAWREKLSVPNFGPVDDSGVRDMFRGFEGLGTQSLRFFVASSHLDLGPTLERPTIAWSRDGKIFTTIAVSYTPPAGDGTRDCSVYYRNGKFYLAYTAGSAGLCEYFGIAVSDGTINGDDELVFTHLVDVPATNADTTWAPEFFEDLDGNLYIGFAQPSGSSPQWELWYVRATSEDLTTWTTPVKIGGVNTGSSKIDMAVIGWDRKYLLVCRNYSGNGAYIYESDSPVSGYTLKSTVDFGDTMEGQNLCNMGNGILRLYYIHNPGGGGGMSYRDSFDGGVTFGDATEIEGDFDVPHMSVLSFLHPTIASSRTLRNDDDIESLVMQSLGVTDPVSYYVPSSPGIDVTTNLDFGPDEVPIVTSSDRRLLLMTVWATEPAVVIRKVYQMKIDKVSSTTFTIERVRLTEDNEAGPDYYDFAVGADVGGDTVNGSVVGKIRLSVTNKIQASNDPNWQVQVQFQILPRPSP